jgi:site-specific DNA-methyltransferase (adenine-specific)
MITLWQGDCLELMKDIPDHSIDCIICDPPYGTTPIEWDKVIDFNLLWEQYNRIAKPNSAVVIFSQEPFATYLRMSNISNYRYDWYWEKERLTNVFQVNKRCGKTVENIIIFYREQCVFNPQKFEHIGKPVTNKIGETARWSVTQSGYSQNTKPFEYHDDGTRHPTQVLRINRDNPRERVHPTQKPIELLEYLVKTYTNEGDTVLDNCAGSGTTGVACKNLKRNFVGIELDPEYFEIAKHRIDNTHPQYKLF